MVPAELVRQAPTREPNPLGVLVEFRGVETLLESLARRTGVTAAEAELERAATALATASDEATADGAVQQLQKVVGVRNAAAFPARDGVTRELALVKVRASAERFRELLDVVQLYHASVVDDNPEATIVELADPRVTYVRPPGELAGGGTPLDVADVPLKRLGDCEQSQHRARA